MHLFIWSRKFWGKDMNLNRSSYEVINKTFTFIFFLLYIHQINIQQWQEKLFFKTKNTEYYIQLSTVVCICWRSLGTISVFMLLWYNQTCFTIALPFFRQSNLFRDVWFGSIRDLAGTLRKYRFVLKPLQRCLSCLCSLLSPWKLNILKPKLQEDISVYFPNSVYLNSPGSEFFYLMTCCFYSDMHCKLWNLI